MNKSMDIPDLLRENINERLQQLESATVVERSVSSYRGWGCEGTCLGTCSGDCRGTCTGGCGGTCGGGCAGFINKLDAKENNL